MAFYYWACFLVEDDVDYCRVLEHQLEEGGGPPFWKHGVVLLNKLVEFPDPLLEFVRTSIEKSFWIKINLIKKNSKKQIRKKTHIGLNITVTNCQSENYPTCSLLLEQDHTSSFFFKIQFFLLLMNHVWPRPSMKVALSPAYTLSVYI